MTTQYTGYGDHVAERAGDAAVLDSIEWGFRSWLEDATAKAAFMNCNKKLVLEGLEQVRLAYGDEVAPVANLIEKESM